MSTTATWPSARPIFSTIMRYIMINVQTTSDRNVQVCGYRLKHFRKLLGWTQEELAHRSGYCDRLIRKAESGRSVSLEAIEVIAQSLCCYGVYVSAEDLICSPKKTVRRLLDAIHGEGIPSLSVEPIATDEVLVECKGSERIPFAGVWKGQDGLQSWLNRLCNSIVANGFDEQNLMAVDGNIAFLQTHVCLRSGSRVSTPLDLVLQMEFDRSLVRSLCVKADSTAIEEFFSHG